jgi:alpha-ketoglutarate-dependent sulfate ester dioxygenase
VTTATQEIAGRSPSSGITLKPLTGHIGVEIGGVDIAQPLDDATVEAIRSALDTWKVVFFRDQHLDHESQIAFGNHFGELTYAHPHDDAPPQGFPEIYTVDPKRFEEQYGIDRTEQLRRYSYTSGWHTDVTPAVNPPAGSILRADVVPEFGGDTTFTNLVVAYERLSDPVKRLVDTLWAEHRYGASPSGIGQKSNSYKSRIDQNSLVANHPVVRVHPRTGERALFVNPVFTDHILDVSPLESRWILEHLFAHLSHPEHTVRFHWEPGSVAFWDNRATAHLGPQDIGHLNVERVLHRVTLIGEVPVGVDGRESQLVEGVPFQRQALFAAAAAS